MSLALQSFGTWALNCKLCFVITRPLCSEPSHLSRIFSWITDELRTRWEVSLVFWRSFWKHLCIRPERVAQGSGTVWKLRKKNKKGKFQAFAEKYRTKQISKHSCYRLPQNPFFARIKHLIRVQLIFQSYSDTFCGLSLLFSLAQQMFTRPPKDANDSLFLLRPWCNAIGVRTPPVADQ